MDLTYLIGISTVIVDKRYYEKVSGQYYMEIGRYFIGNSNSYLDMNGERVWFSNGTTIKASRSTGEELAWRLNRLKTRKGNV